MIFYIEQKYTIEFYKVLIQNIIKAVRLFRLSIASDDFFFWEISMPNASNTMVPVSSYPDW